MRIPLRRPKSLKVKTGTVEIYTADEFQKVLAAAPDEFRACVAIGGFAGLRSAEIERLRWEDIDLKQRHIVVGVDRAKTAARRVIPMGDALLAWLTFCKSGSGLVWQGTRDGFYVQQRITAKRSEIRWKANALRHSYASYRFAECADAGRVASLAILRRLFIGTTANWSLPRLLADGLPWCRLQEAKEA